MKKVSLGASFFLLFIFLMSFNLINTGNASSNMWSKSFGNEAGDYGRSLIETFDGGYVLAGWTESTLGEETDYLLIKTDANGNMQWNQTYGGENWEKAYCVIETNDEGYALVGNTLSFGAGNHDFWLVKTDSFGNMQWNRTFGGPESEGAYSVVQTADGGFVLAGETVSVGSANYDFFVVKTDEYGSMEWSQTYGGTGTETAYSLVETSDGGCAIAGYTNSFGAGNYDFWLIKTDSLGNMEWNKTYGGANWDEARCVVQTNDGGYGICGMTASYGAGSNDFWLVKTDSSGNIEWSQTFGGKEYEKAHGLIETNDEGFAVVGYTSKSVFDNDFLLVKTDEYGGMQWNHTYGNSDWQIAYSLVMSSDGGYIILGETLLSSGAVDFWLIKTDEFGVVPEFPSWIVLPLFLIATVVITAYRKKMKR